MITETCGADRVIEVEEKAQPGRLVNDSFVTRVNGQLVDYSQHFVGVGVVPEDLREFIRRCGRCTGHSRRKCDINAGTFQHPDPQE